MEYYVYALIDPRTNQPFYIGKGKGNRMYHHLKDYTTGVRKLNVINEIREAGLEPIPTKLIDCLDEDTAYQKETELIKLYGRKGIDKEGILSNNLLEVYPPVMTDELKTRISEARTGIRFTEDHKQKLSSAKKGKTWEEIYGDETAAELRVKASSPRGSYSDEHKQAISDAKKGIRPHNWNDSARKKLSNTTKGISKSNGKALSEYHKQEKTCPHCGQKGAGVAMMRWHFDNCKQKGK